MGRFFTPRRCQEVCVCVCVCVFTWSVVGFYFCLLQHRQCCCSVSGRQGVSFGLCVPSVFPKIIKYSFLSPRRSSSPPPPPPPPPSAATVPLQNRCSDWRGVQRHDFLPRFKGKSLSPLQSNHFIFLMFSFFYSLFSCSFLFWITSVICYLFLFLLMGS